MASVIVKFPGNLSQVDTIDDLRALPSAYIPNGRAFLVSDPPSQYLYDTGASGADNGTTIIKPNDKTADQLGRFKQFSAGGGGGGHPVTLVAITLDDLKAAPIDNVTMLYDGATFNWTLGDFTGQADDINIVKQDDTALSAGAWVRQSAATIAYQFSTATRRSDLQTELRKLDPRPETFYLPADGTDMALSFSRCIAYCQTANRNMQLSDRNYQIETPIVLDGPPIAIRGPRNSVPQQGSSPPSCMLSWWGGADYMFDARTGNWRFLDFGFENRGTGKGFLKVDGQLFSTYGGGSIPATGQRFIFQGLSCAISNYAPRFSEALFDSIGNNFGYSEWLENTWLGAAPYIVRVNSAGTSNGLTPLLFKRNLVESIAGGSVCVLELTSVNCDRVDFVEETWNQHVNQLYAIDTRAATTGGALAVGILNFDNCEIDVGNASDDINSDRRFGYIKNCPSVHFWGMEMQGGGTQTALFELYNSHAWVYGGHGFSIAGPVWNLDATSRVRFVAKPDMNLPNTRGLVNDSNNDAQGFIYLPYSSVVLLKGQLAEESGSVFRVDVTNTEPWTLSYADAAGGQGYNTKGQSFSVLIYNGAGTTIPDIDVVGSIHVRGGYIKAPAVGEYVVLTLFWTGAAYEEIGNRQFAAARTVTYTAPPAETYIAPTGGATVDAEGRAALEQLRTDHNALKAVVAALAADDANIWARLQAAGIAA